MARSSLASSAFGLAVVSLFLVRHTVASECIDATKATSETFCRSTQDCPIPCNSEDFGNCVVYECNTQAGRCNFRYFHGTNPDDLDEEGNERKYDCEYRDPNGDHVYGFCERGKCVDPCVGKKCPEPTNACNKSTCSRGECGERFDYDKRGQACTAPHGGPGLCWADHAFCTSHFCADPAKVRAECGVFGTCSGLPAGFELDPAHDHTYTCECDGMYPNGSAPPFCSHGGKSYSLGQPCGVDARKKLCFDFGDGRSAPPMSDLTDMISSGERDEAFRVALAASQECCLTTPRGQCTKKGQCPKEGEPLKVHRTAFTVMTDAEKILELCKRAASVTHESQTGRFEIVDGVCHVPKTGTTLSQTRDYIFFDDVARPDGGPTLRQSFSKEYKFTVPGGVHIQELDDDTDGWQFELYSLIDAPSWSELKDNSPSENSVPCSVPSNDPFYFDENGGASATVDRANYRYEKFTGLGLMENRFTRGGPGLEFVNMDFNSNQGHEDKFTPVTNGPERYRYPWTQYLPSGSQGAMNVRWRVQRAENQLWPRKDTSSWDNFGLTRVKDSLLFNEFEMNFPLTPPAVNTEDLEKDWYANDNCDWPYDRPASYTFGVLTYTPKNAEDTKPHLWLEPDNVATGCALGNGGCARGFICVPGATAEDPISCLCPPNTSPDADGKFCSSIDPCTINNGGCGAHATCKEGDYPERLPICTCQRGFVGAPLCMPSPCSDGEKFTECGDLSSTNCVATPAPLEAEEAAAAVEKSQSENWHALVVDGVQSNAPPLDKFFCLSNIQFAVRFVKQNDGTTAVECASHDGKKCAEGYCTASQFNVPREENFYADVKTPDGEPDPEDLQVARPVHVFMRYTHYWASAASRIVKLAAVTPKLLVKCQCLNSEDVTGQAPNCRHRDVCETMGCDEKGCVSDQDDPLGLGFCKSNDCEVYGCPPAGAQCETVAQCFNHRCEYERAPANTQCFAHSVGVYRNACGTCGGNECVRGECTGREECPQDKLQCVEEMGTYHDGDELPKDIYGRPMELSAGDCYFKRTAHFKYCTGKLTGLREWEYGYCDMRGNCLNAGATEGNDVPGDKLCRASVFSQEMARLKQACAGKTCEDLKAGSNCKRRLEFGGEEYCVQYEEPPTDVQAELDEGSQEGEVLAGSSCRSMLYNQDLGAPCVSAGAIYAYMETHEDNAELAQWTREFFECRGWTIKPASDDAGGDNGGGDNGGGDNGGGDNGGGDNGGGDNGGGDNGGGDNGGGDNGGGDNGGGDNGGGDNGGGDNGGGETGGETDVPSNGKAVLVEWSTAAGSVRVVTTVPAGTTVVWKIADGLPHTVTGVEGVSVSGLNSEALRSKDNEAVEAGGVKGAFSFLASKVGVTSYRCSFHTDMQGELRVESPSSDGTGGGDTSGGSGGDGGGDDGDSGEPLTSKVCEGSDCCDVVWSDQAPSNTACDCEVAAKNVECAKAMSMYHAIQTSVDNSKGCKCPTEKGARAECVQKSGERDTCGKAQTPTNCALACTSLAEGLFMLGETTASIPEDFTKERCSRDCGKGRVPKTELDAWSAEVAAALRAAAKRAEKAAADDAADLKKWNELSGDEIADAFDDAFASLSGDATKAADDVDAKAERAKTAVHAGDSGSELGKQVTSLLNQLGGVSEKIAALPLLNPDTLRSTTAKGKDDAKDVDVSGKAQFDELAAEMRSLVAKVRSLELSALPLEVSTEVTAYLVQCEQSLQQWADVLSVLTAATKDSPEADYHAHVSGVKAATEQATRASAVEFTTAADAAANQQPVGTGAGAGAGDDGGSDSMLYVYIGAGAGALVLIAVVALVVVKRGGGGGGGGGGSGSNTSQIPIAGASSVVDMETNHLHSMP